MLKTDAVIQQGFFCRKMKKDIRRQAWKDFLKCESFITFRVGRFGGIDHRHQFLMLKINLANAGFQSGRPSDGHGTSQINNR